MVRERHRCGTARGKGPGWRQRPGRWGSVHRRPGGLTGARLASTATAPGEGLSGRTQPLSPGGPRPGVWPPGRAGAQRGRTSPPAPAAVPRLTGVPAPRRQCGAGWPLETPRLSWGRTRPDTLTGAPRASAPLPFDRCSCHFSGLQPGPERALWSHAGGAEEDASPWSWAAGDGARGGEGEGRRPPATLGTHRHGHAQGLPAPHREVGALERDAGSILAPEEEGGGVPSGSSGDTHRHSLSCHGACGREHTAPAPHTK